MAAEKVQFTVDVKDDGSATLKKVERNFENMAKKVGASMQKAGAAMTVAGAAVVAFGAQSIKAFQAQENAEKRLAQIATQVTGATAEQIDGFKNLASEMQEVGVIGDEVLIAGQSQIASFTKSSDVVTELSDDLADLAVATYGSNVSQEQAIQTANNLGKALSGQLGALTRTGILVSDDLKKAFEEANTEQERAAILSKIIQDNYGGMNEAMRETSEGRLQALQNSFGDLVEQLGGTLIPILDQIVQAITPIVESISKWIEENPEMANTIGLVVIALGGLMAILGPILIVLGTMVIAIGAIATPVLIVIGVIAALAAGFFFAQTAWNNAVALWNATLPAMQELFTAIFTAIQSFFTQVWEDITSFLEETVTNISNMFSEFWEGTQMMFEEALMAISEFFIEQWEAMSNFITELWLAVQAMFASAWQAIQQTFTTVLTAINNLFRSIWNGIKGFFATIWVDLTTAVSDGLDTMLGFIADFTEPIIGAFDAMWTGAGDTLINAVGAIQGTLKGMLNWIIDQINSVIAGLNGLASAGQALGVQIPTIPSIPRLAEGGIVTKPTLAVIGEAGPEAVVPLSGGNRPSGGMGGGEIHYHFPNAVISSKEAVMEMFDEATREFAFSNKMV